MTKIMVLVGNKNIEELVEYADSFLIGLKDYSVNLGYYFDYYEIKKIVKYLKEKNKEVFISINKNIHSYELDNLKKLLLEIDLLDVNGIFYYDVGIVNLKQKLNLKTPLVWSAEHLTTNYATINFYQKHNVDYTYLSSEITLEEILEIKKNTNVSLIVPIFGYLPMFVSERNAIKNYLNNFNLKDNKRKYIEKEDKKYKIIEENGGVSAYASKILNGYNEYLVMKENNIDYVTLNELDIDKELFIEVLKIFKLSDSNLKTKIDELFDNVTSSHFLHTETIYRVKK